MSQVTVTIDGKACAASSDSTILEAAVSQGIEIPTLCKIKELDPTANCRLCVTEVEGARTLLTACSTRVQDGMKVQTQSDKVIASRKMSLELLLSRHAVDCHHCLRNGHSKSGDLDPLFCEMCFFCDCVRDGFCELQSLATEYKVDVLPFDEEPNNHTIDDSSAAIIRNGNKCINCRRCIEVCGQVQQVNNLVVANRGSNATIQPLYGSLLAESDCIQCGKCADICPTGAIAFKEHIDEILYHTHDYGTVTVAQVSDDILLELTSLFGVEPERKYFERVFAGLKKIGIDFVFTDAYTKGLSKQTGESALKENMANHPSQAMILTESLAAVKFIDKYYQQLREQLVTYPSSQQVFGSYIRETFIAEKNLSDKQVKIISIANKSEGTNEAAETGCTDYHINARQLYRIFLRTGVDITIDYPASLCNAVSEPESHAASELFADTPWAIGSEPIYSQVDFDGKALKVATAVNLGQAKQLFSEIKQQSNEFDVIRIM